MLNVRIPSNQRESVRIPAQDLALNIKEKRTGFNVSIKIRMWEKYKFKYVIFFFDFMKMNETKLLLLLLNVFAMYEIYRVNFVQMTDFDWLS